MFVKSGTRNILPARQMLGKIFFFPFFFRVVYFICAVIFVLLFYYKL